MIYVTHDQVEAMTLADRIVVLANKGIAQIGTPLDLYERPENEFVARFIGSPAMNLWPGKISGTGKQTKVTLDNGGHVVSDVPTEDGDMDMPVNVGVRPEDLVIVESDPLYTCKVRITELLGEVTQVHFVVNGDEESVIAKLPGIVHDLAGKELHLGANASKVHLFSEGRSLLYR
jgi:alpha-glucoside transport system ATP-binding protein